MIQYLDRMLKGIMQGFVWIEDETVIGNVSLYPAGFDQNWVIANVAVHPDYRGQGIAHQLCQAALERIVEWGGRAAILQVDETNHAAQRLYDRLGFFAERSFTRWQWFGSNRPPQPLADMPYITYRSVWEWKAAYELVNLQRPNSRGGLGWLRPTREGSFRPSFWRSLGRLLEPGSYEEWVVRDLHNHLRAWVLCHIGFGSSTMRFDLIVHPDQQGELEEPLVNYALRRAANQLRGAYTDHPADDGAADQVFRRYHFRPLRTFVHMTWRA
jgi:predicted GNAT family acetyltransferase